MSVASKSLAPGTLVEGRYRVVGTLAEGGMGAVYDVLDERLDRPVAMKVLRRELADEQEARRRFEREARLVAKLGHPNIAQVLDFGHASDGASYLVMERVPGETLSKILERDKRVEPMRAAEIVRQALDGVAAAHATGIVHRDIKPGNVMVFRVGASARDMVKVLDFGIASFVTTQTYTRLTHTGVIVGTPAYMAPEQARGEPVDARTDVYAMGVLLYCLLAGRKPFQGDVAAMLEGVLFSEPPPVASFADVSPELAAIVARAMRKGPATRFGTASEMSLALASLLPERMSFVPNAPASQASSARASSKATAPTPPSPISPRPSRLPIAPRSSVPQRSSAAPSGGSGRAPSPTLSLGASELPSQTSLSPPAPGATSGVMRAASASALPPPMTPAPMTPAPMTPAPMTPAPMTPAPMTHGAPLPVASASPIRRFAIVVTVISAVLATGLTALAVVIGVGAWFWTTREVAAAAPVPAVPPPAPVARGPVAPPYGVGAGGSAGGVGSVGSVGGVTGSAVCVRAVGCCQALSRVGVIEPSACSMYSSPYMPESSCHEVLASYAIVLRSRGADDRECSDPDAQRLIGLEAESPAQVMVVTGGSIPGAVPVTGGGPVHGGSNSPSCRGWFSTQPQLRVDVGAGVSELEISVEAPRDTTLLVRGPNGSIECDDDSGGGLNPMVRVSSRDGDHFSVFVGVYSGGATSATAHVTRRR